MTQAPFGQFLLGPNVIVDATDSAIGAPHEMKTVVAKPPGCFFDDGELPVIRILGSVVACWLHSALGISGHE